MSSKPLVFGVTILPVVRDRGHITYYGYFDEKRHSAFLSSARKGKSPRPLFVTTPRLHAWLSENTVEVSTGQTVGGIHLDLDSKARSVVLSFATSFGHRTQGLGMFFQYAVERDFAKRYRCENFSLVLPALILRERERLHSWFEKLGHSPVEKPLSLAGDVRALRKGLALHTQISRYVEDPFLLGPRGFVRRVSRARREWLKLAGLPHRRLSPAAIIKRQNSR